MAWSDVVSVIAVVGIVWFIISLCILLGLKVMIKDWKVIANSWKDTAMNHLGDLQEVHRQYTNEVTSLEKDVAFWKSKWDNLVRFALDEESEEEKD